VIVFAKADNGTPDVTRFADGPSVHSMAHKHPELLFLTASHRMQTRSSDDNFVCPSVRLSVCLSVYRTGDV